MTRTELYARALALTSLHLKAMKLDIAYDRATPEQRATIRNIMSGIKLTALRIENDLAQQGVLPRR